MLKLGEVQTLTVIKKVEFGIYLGLEDNPEERVLLVDYRSLPLSLALTEREEKENTPEAADTPEVPAEAENLPSEEG